MCYLDDIADGDNQSFLLDLFSKNLSLMLRVSASEDLNVKLGTLQAHWVPHGGFV